MANTGITAHLAAIYADEAVIVVSASGLATATIGDWIVASASWAIAGGSGVIGEPAFKASAFGVALTQNPTVDGQGGWKTNSAFLVARRGVMRVSAGNSGSARTIPIGSYCFPNTTASGIVGGATGASGVAGDWLTAAPVSISGNPTGAMASGVAIVINHPIGGDSGIGQLDIVFNLATNSPWL
jgi:hypothetical protein